MTTDELERLLAQQPVAVLHRLARGRVQRHFRAGKRRLIELLLQHSSQNRAGFESDLLTLIGERQSSPTAGSSRRPGAPPVVQKHVAMRSSDTEPSDPPISLTEWLQGLGVPAPQPFVQDPWQIEALAAVSETDVVISVPTGSGKTYVAIEAARRAMEDNRSVIYTSPL
ncbi:MAG TPA: hypothetical protein DEA71_16980, partial [Nitrospira sp.]|nr:hypothetical protein [Nitrospira sp.]